MEHIRTRSEMVEAVLKRSPTRAIARAIREGQITLYGGFTKIPPFDRAGWISQVRSRHGRTWHLALLVDEVKHQYACHIIEDVPWHLWAGMLNRSRIYVGDDPTRNYWTCVFACEREARRHADSEE